MSARQVVGALHPLGEERFCLLEHGYGLFGRFRSRLPGVGLPAFFELCHGAKDEALVSLLFGFTESFEVSSHH